jgi:hypothetical protein
LHGSSGRSDAAASITAAEDAGTGAGVGSGTGGRRALAAEMRRRAIGTVWRWAGGGGGFVVE